MWVEEGTTTLESLVEELAARATDSQGVPVALATRAKRITADNLSHLASATLDPVAVRRVRNYFAAVIRRASVRARTPEVREYRRRLIEASLVADLRAAGVDEDRVRTEVAASLSGAPGWSQRAS